MDILQLYQDYSVDYKTDGHKHCRPGWVNTPCPFCVGNPGYHLGYEIQSDHYFCWRCGFHPVVFTISKLINKNYYDTELLVKKYGLLISSYQPAEKKPKQPHRMPSGIGPLEKQHKRYLESRLFDPDYLIRTWHLVGTGPVSLLDHIDYKHRIIVPIIWDLQAASFQGRDITGKDPMRYRACPKARELIEHKQIVFGKQEKWTGKGICVEGITDVFRFGVKSFCTFGIEYTHAQVRVIAKNFKRVAVVFDDDPQAIVQAKKLTAELRFRNVDAYTVPIVGDPGAMKQSEANYFVKQII